MMLERLGETKRLWEVSRKTRISRRFSGRCLLCSIPRLKRFFLCGFLWFFAVSLAAFFVLSWLFSEEWIKVMDEYIVPNCTALNGAWAYFFLTNPGQCAVARQQACL